MTAIIRILKHNRWLLLAIGLFLVTAFLLFDPKLYTGGDNAIYMILAQSLARGTGYTDIHLPVPTSHTQYPPGFPALLALLVLLSGTVNVLAAKLLVFFCGVVALVFAYRLLGQALDDASPWPMLILVSMPVLALYSSRVLSDIPFLLLTVASLWLVLRAEEKPGGTMWAGLLLAVCALMFRTAGIALVLGIAAYLVLRRNWRWLAVFVLLLCVVFVPWLVRNIAVGSERSYLDLLLARHHYMPEYGRIGVSGLFTRVWNNLTGYGLKMLPLAFVPLLGRGLPAVLTGILLIAFAAIGFIRRLRSRSVLEPFAVCTGLMLLAWPDKWLDVRFLLPLLPALVVYVVTALRWLGDRMRFRHLVPVFTIALLALNAIGLWGLSSQSLSERREFLAGDRLSGYSDDWRRYFEAIDWVKAHVPQDQVIMARKPEFVYLLSGHKSFCYPFVHDSTRLTRAVFESDYVIFDNFRWNDATRHFLTPIFDATPERFLVAWKGDPPLTYVIKVSKPEPETSDTLPGR
jgi:4-amino-4-deoxy-L-arabinose transferase-like glycosyltransferase